MQTLSARGVRATPARAQRAQRSTLVTKAVLTPQVAIGGATVAALVLGRFVFHGWVKTEGERVSATPKTTADGFFEDLQKPASFATSTKDPEAFTAIELLGWGALGHVAGYTALALDSLHR